MNEIKPSPAVRIAGALEGVAKFLGWGGAPVVATVLAIVYGDTIAERLGVWVLALLGCALLWWALLDVATGIRDRYHPLPVPPEGNS